MVLVEPITLARKAETKTLVNLLVESVELRRDDVEEQLKKSVEAAELFGHRHFHL